MADSKEKSLTPAEKETLAKEASEALLKKEEDTAKKQGPYKALDRLYKLTRKAGISADEHDAAKEDAVTLNQYIAKA